MHRHTDLFQKSLITSLLSDTESAAMGLATEPGMVAASPAAGSGQVLVASKPDAEHSNFVTSSRAKDYLRLGIPAIARTSNPRDYPRSLKHVVTSMVAACGLATPLGSNIFLPVIAPAARDFDTTPTVMNLSISFYCLAVAITPMWWAVLSEHQGSRRTYVLTFFFFIVFNVASALSVSPAMFISMRLLAGAASAPVQALGAATVAHLWELEERGRAMGIFLLGSMCGNVFGPILGGALGQRWGWRSTQWFMVIYGAVVWFAILFFVPETSNVTMRSEKTEAPRTGKVTVGRRVRAVLSALAKPAGLLKLLRFPPVLITVFYTGVAFAAYYVVMIVIQATFSAPPYSYSPLIVGLLYMPNALGNVLAATLGGRWTDRIMRRKAAAAGRPRPRPQDALGLNAWLAALVYPAAVLVAGWTSWAHPRVPAVPLIANFFFAMGNMMMQNITTVTLTEFVPGRAAAGVALANLVRNTLGAAASVAAQPLLDAIGVGWLSTIVALLCGASAACIWLLQRNAVRWADEMKEKMAPQPPPPR
ncbi:MFS multidrug resistance transporter [Chaetomium strumarium]|uniref:MFS multidrug resistance transporter n=1 Tax=Chaetomium strumarium TaxID=1170767 RepID=A0AAJ0GW39_9PEZI|nr:MFS multidrug resistance transporter [Chaetomium strumarium]